MNCINCKFWSRIVTEFGATSTKFGQCTNDKIFGVELVDDTDTIDTELYGDEIIIEDEYLYNKFHKKESIITGEKFGCIHFKQI